MTYKLINAGMGMPPQFVLQKETGKMIPFDPANTDYQEYLEWVAEGNTPEEAE